MNPYELRAGEIRTELADLIAEGFDHWLPRRENFDGAEEIAREAFAEGVRLGYYYAAGSGEVGG